MSTTAEFPYLSVPIAQLRNQNWPYIRLRLKNLVAKVLRRRTVCAHELTFRRHFAHSSKGVGGFHILIVLEAKARAFTDAVDEYRLRKGWYEISSRCEAISMDLNHPVCKYQIYKLFRCAQMAYEELVEAYAAARCFHGDTVPQDLLNEKLFPASLRKRLEKDVLELGRAPFK